MSRLRWIRRSEAHLLGSQGHLPLGDEFKADRLKSPSFRVERHGTIAVIVPSQDVVRMQENLFQHIINYAGALSLPLPPGRV